MVIEDETSDADYEEEESAGEEAPTAAKQAQADKKNAPITMVRTPCHAVHCSHT